MRGGVLHSTGELNWNGIWISNIQETANNPLKTYCGLDIDDEFNDLDYELQCIIFSTMVDCFAYVFSYPLTHNLIKAESQKWFSILNQLANYINCSSINSSFKPLPI